MTLADAGSGAGVGFFLILIAAVLYFLPTLVAFSRAATVRGTVAVLNFFLGWTVIGWVVSLAMAFGPTEQKAGAGEK